MNEQDFHGEERVRFATREELVAYVDYHASLIMKKVRGVEDIFVEEDEAGAFILLKVRDNPQDGRKLDVEEVAQLMVWRSVSNERVQARVLAKRMEE